MTYIEDNVVVNLTFVLTFLLLSLIFLLAFGVIFNSSFELDLGPFNVWGVFYVVVALGLSYLLSHILVQRAVR